MGLARLYSRAITGMIAPEVIVEVHVAGGLPSFSIVGLPDTEVKESRDRVRSAIQTSGFDFPARRITVNLAPADLPKESGRYDLAIALGVLIASGLVTPKIDIAQLEFAGELALNGELRHTHGTLAMAYNAHQNRRDFILPLLSADEANLVAELNVYAANTLNQVIDHLTQKEILQPLQKKEYSIEHLASKLDFSHVKGQLSAKKSLEIAASGRHSILMLGSPGCGKSMLAERLTSIMPQLNNAEALESAAIWSLSSNGFNFQQFGKIPFRRPHHSASGVALVGGGSNPKPGEISLAHKGVLFLDELPEFDRKVLEVLREPLETKTINIARANSKVDFPADFQLLAAMNPCPCGNRDNKKVLCKCSPEQIARYLNKLSGPFLDRIDLIVEVPQLETEELQHLPNGECSTQIRQRVVKARDLQYNRQNKLNYALDNNEIDKYCIMESAAKDFLGQITNKLNLSARAYYRLLKVARSIADLDGLEQITKQHLAQATQYKRTF